MSVRKIFLSVICLSCFLSAHAGQGADSVRIYYRAGYRYVEPGFRDNRAALKRLIRNIGEAHSAGRLERISVHSYASPRRDKPCQRTALRTTCGFFGFLYRPSYRRCRRSYRQAGRRDSVG